jgi:DNA gyrase subunit B
MLGRKIMSNSYGADELKTLKGLLPVRERPGMYIGTTDIRGLHHLIWEIIDNSIDEASAGYANLIKVELLSEDRVRVTDNGRGIPVDFNEREGIRGIDMVFGRLHSGGKFDNTNYKASSGLHGVGASVVNALSEYLKCTVNRQGKSYQMLYELGNNKEKLENPVGIFSELGDTKEQGTIVEFKPDPTVFPELVFDLEVVKNRLKQLAYLNPGVTLVIRDCRVPEPLEFKYKTEGGIVEYVKDLNLNKKDPIGNIIYLNKDCAIANKLLNNEMVNINVQVALQYCKGSVTSDSIYTFANGVNTIEGGTHLEGFSQRLTFILNELAAEKKVFKKEEKFSGDDVRIGLTAVIYVKHPNPQFEGQTKSKLGSADARTAVSQTMTEDLKRYLLEYPEDLKLILEKCVHSFKTRKNIEAYKETQRNNPLDGLNIASKLADCRSKDANISELYIVEGDSAGGSAKQGRDSFFQAILPLRGKILNVERVDKDKAYENNEINSLIRAIGTGLNEDFNIEKARYHKVVIMTDADIDGAHIRTLLLTFFFRYLRGLIDAGYIYFAQPPLYKVQLGRNIKYAYSDEELETIKSEMNGKPSIQRYKGLGEMDAEQLWETTMDPKGRTLLRATLVDAEKADETFSMLMGEDVPPRREFITENAKYVTNLDNIG